MPSSLGRLRRRAEFLRAARAGHKWAAPGLVLQALKRPSDVDDEASVRVGFTASRKVGNAVCRNRARRRLRAVVAEVLPRVGRRGFDYVVIARKETLTRDHMDLLADLETAVRKAKPRVRR